MKKTPISRIPAFALIGSVFALSACGGGGGGGGGGSGGSSGQAPVSTISAANAPAVAAQSLSASGTLDGQLDGAAGTASLVTGVSVAGGRPALIEASMAQVYRALQSRPSNLASLVTGVSESQTINCQGGGTLTVSYRMTTPDSVSNGDSASISSSNCVEDGVRMNGSISFAFSNVSGTPSSSSSWSATLSISFGNFTVVDGSAAATASGDLTLAYSQSASGASYSAQGSRLEVSSTENGRTVARTITAYRHAGTVTASGSSYSSDFTFSGNLPGVGDNVSYTVDTLVDFQELDGSNPHAGVMTVRAADNTSLKLTVLNSGSVQIEIDRTGDGNSDETITRTWAELYALM